MPELKSSWSQWVVVLGGKEHSFWSEEAMLKFCQMLESGPHPLSYQVFLRDTTQYLIKEHYVQADS